MLVSLALSLSWNPEPATLTPAELHVSWSGWPFVHKQVHRKLSPSGANQIVHAEYAKPELSINVGVAIVIVTVLYFGLTRFGFRSFPRFALLDILSLMVGVSIAFAYFAANPDTYLWNLRHVFKDGTEHSLYVLQRPVWQNAITCILIVLAGYSGSQILLAGQRGITKR